MNPMAAETDKGMLKIHRAMNPPIMARGTLIRMSAALLMDLNASNKRTKINNKEMGTTTDKRSMARS
jgi:hypothetical protein